MLILIICALSGVYFLTVFSFFLGLFLNNGKKNDSLNSISVIIAARNEEKSLPALLNILQKQTFPQNSYEIIVANDRSSDGTKSILEIYSRKIPNLIHVDIVEESKELVGKKGALAKAIALARNELLAFTDADCLPTRYWLEEINSHFAENVDFVAGYSFLKYQNKFLEGMKNLERAAIFAVTAGSFGLNRSITCSAGNIAYRREMFNKVNGFSGIGHIRSGDDDLMLQKMASFLKKKRFMFSKRSFVETTGHSGSSKQIAHETRRGSKFKNYTPGIKLMVFSVFLFYLAYIVLFASAFFDNALWRMFISISVIKVLPEFLLLFSFLKRIDKVELMKYFVLAEMIYIPYFIFFGLKGTFGNYRWKD